MQKFSVCTSSLNIIGSIWRTMQLECNSPLVVLSSKNNGRVDSYTWSWFQKWTNSPFLHLEMFRDKCHVEILHFGYLKCIQSVSWRQWMLTGLLHCHRIYHLVPGRFPPVSLSMLLSVTSETPPTIPTSLLVFVGNIFTSLVYLLFSECKLHDNM